ncbi:ATP-binding protein [Pseudonocardia oceani]|uniref:Winged helix-turn-helix domain-containing protein n=4 Tax=Pseudonocardia oceani TaxID=2792013 RepID=A0ABS6U3U9_9PSEU|nr:BTAD domain-containing putative transcriptional regulator [Pseudonocardia oceani]MBW0126643.1 winged helix-turn-helix domain-containing protein [Pseudonocardia oceani]
MRGIDFRLLGPLEVHVGGEPVRVPGAAERALLALLLLAGRHAVPATTLVDQLWGSAELPVDPMNALQLRVSKLRRFLSAHGEDVVVRDGVGYRMDVDPDAVDVQRFVGAVRRGRALARVREATGAVRALGEYDAAFRLWRGDPLIDFVTHEWAAIEATRLSQMRLAALAERAEIGLGIGRHGEVAADLGPLVASEPTQERLVGLLITALYRDGRQAEALEVFARTRAVLADELGLEPSAELRALHQRVLRQDPRLDPAPAIPDPGAEAAASSRPAGNIPAEVTPLVGRADELFSMGELLGSTRLLTLVGPGGAGKTALSLALARSRTSAYPDGASVVGLAAVAAAGDVALAVADALGVPLDGGAHGSKASTRLVSYLARRELLLVLDNCEHVIDAAARLAVEILAGCPRVTIMATSREALAVPGEVQVMVAPLAVPPVGTAPERVLSYPAAELFVQRAAAVRRGFRLDDSDLVAVARVVTALDGMPLALELAAARASSLSPTELADRLADRFALLRGGARTADARHRALRATVDWSHTLLTGPEQVLFRRMAVFHGGWTLDAAEAVAAGPGVERNQVLDLLGRLVDQSMVIAEPGLPTRYRMLQTLQQYADEQLETAGERDDVAARHAGWFRELAETAEDSLRGRGQRLTLRRLRTEQSNLRAALAWLGADPSRLEKRLRLAGALGWFWHLGRHIEGRAILRGLPGEGGSPAARARALQAVSLVERPRACLVHPSPRCEEAARTSLALFSEIGDARRAAVSRVLLAVQGVTGVDPDGSERLLEEAEEQFTRDFDHWGRAVVAFVRLETFLKAGDEDRALPAGRAAADAFRALDDPWGLSAVLYHLGWGLRQLGRYTEAVPVLEEAIAVAASADLHNTVQWALADLGIAHVHLGHPGSARRCFDRARSASEQVGDGAGEVLAAFGYAVLASTAGEWGAARAGFADALAGFSALGTPLPAGLALAGLARCDEEDGLVDAAEDRYQQVLRAGEDTGEPDLTARALEGRARIAATRGDTLRAATLSARAAAVRAEAHRPLPPHERAEAARTP